MLEPPLFLFRRQRRHVVVQRRPALRCWHVVVRSWPVPRRMSVWSRRRISLRPLVRRNVGYGLIIAGVYISRLSMIRSDTHILHPGGRHRNEPPSALNRPSCACGGYFVLCGCNFADCHRVYRTAISSCRRHSNSYDNRAGQ
jgi:hypothetical protein